MVAVSVGTLLVVTTLASGLLAFWVFVRFPSLTPRTIALGFVHLFAAVAVADVALAALPAALEVPVVGFYVVLLGLVVVPLTYIFLSSMWLLATALQAAFSGGLR